MGHVEIEYVDIDSSDLLPITNQRIELNVRVISLIFENDVTMNESVTQIINVANSKGDATESIEQVDDDFNDDN